MFSFSQDERGNTAAGRLALRRRIECVDKVGERDNVVARIVFGDVEVRRLHERADDFMDLSIEVLEIRRLARHLRDAKQRLLHRLAAAFLSYVAEIPRPPSMPLL